jgi:hypothetical protein
MMRRQSVAVAVAFAGLAGCGELAVVCTDIPRWALDVAILDAETDTPTADGASVIAVNGAYYDSLFVSSNVASVRAASEGPPGTYTLRVRKPGFVPVQQQVIVPGSTCGAEMTEAVAYLFASNHQ